jgi:lipid-A-disaccharide synthase
MLRIGIIAGEVSGDMLASDLINALKKRRADIEVTGIGGSGLRDAGCILLYPMQKLAVMGIAEVLGRFPEILKIRRDVRDYFLANPPDIFIGVDAPDFNFPLERALRGAGIKTIHYVSPSIWAWRAYRLRSIARSVDMMLTVFPFENTWYEKHNIPVCFVGHPLARKIAMHTDKTQARKKLGLAEDKIVIAILPGSRTSELEKHIGPFLQAAEWCRQRMENLHFISSLLDENATISCRDHAAMIVPQVELTAYTGRSLEVMAAADVVLLASGTAALEAMLLKRPMVVGHKVNWLTYQLAKRLVRIPWVSLPNILAGRKLVPECLQDDCTPEHLGSEILNWLQHPERVAKLVEEFTGLHRLIRTGSDDVLANAVLRVLDAAA